MPEWIGDKFYYMPEDRRAHWYLIGTSGAGKTTMLKNILIGDMEQGDGLCFVDLHGDAAEEVLGNVPKHRVNDVLYFDPMWEHSVAFNFLRIPEYEPDKLASSVSDLLESFAKGAWGPRLNQVIKHALLALVHDMRDTGAVWTLRDLQDFLQMKSLRNQIVPRLRLARLKKFWEVDFAMLGEKAVQPVVNKLTDFLLPGSVMERVFSEPDNDLNFFEAMQQKKIIIVRLAKGRFGEAPAQLLGSVIVQGVQAAALARESVPKAERHPFNLVVDEFQNFVTGPFESILSETRKYNVFLTLAHQLLHQVPQGIVEHVFGIVPMMISFRVGPKDAALLQKTMHKQVMVYKGGKSDPRSWPYQIYMDKVARKLEEKIEWVKRPDPEGMSEENLASRNAKKVQLIQTYEEALDIVETHDPNTPLPYKVLSAAGLSNDELDLKFEEWPSVGDFTKLPDYTCYVRWKQSHNIWQVPAYTAPEPEERITKMIRVRMTMRSVARKEAQEARQAIATPVHKKSKHPTPAPSESLDDPTDAIE